MDSNSDSDSSNTWKAEQDNKRKVLRKKRKVKHGMVAEALQYEYINKSVAFQDLDFKKFIFRYQDLVEKYSVSADTIINDGFS